MKQTEKTLLRVEDVAHQLAVKPITVYVWFHKGRIAGIKIGKLVRFRQADIDEFLRKMGNKAERGQKHAD